MKPLNTAEHKVSSQANCRNLYTEETVENAVLRLEGMEVANKYLEKI